MPAVTPAVTALARRGSARGPLEDLLAVVVADAIAPIVAELSEMLAAAQPRRLSVTAEVAAGMLGISEQQVRDLGRAGVLPTVALGRSERAVRYPVAGLSAWIDAHTQGGSP